LHSKYMVIIHRTTHYEPLDDDLCYSESRNC
jgi:hypothetical protein